MPYSESEKKMLLRHARETIRANLQGKQPPPLPYPSPAAFAEPRACFVTLHAPGGALRGCIGCIEAHEPLWDDVERNAQSSAFSDPRFRPVSSERELDTLTLEISVLTLPEPISGPEGFVVGEHGVILRVGRRSAVFLPQVAPEQGWTREETLEHLSMKAGLPPDAWRTPDAKFLVFKAIVFSEHA